MKDEHIIKQQNYTIHRKS